MDFSLHPKLAEDSHYLGKLDNTSILLSRNAHFPWFLLVPQTRQRELHQLAPEQQNAVLEQINLVSRFIEDSFRVEKLNVACIGNIVPQMHIHIVGRNRDDICWPNVVWGIEQHKAYQEAEVHSIKMKLQQNIGNRFHDQQ